MVNTEILREVLLRSRSRERLLHLFEVLASVMSEINVRQLDEGRAALELPRSAGVSLGVV